MDYGTDIAFGLACLDGDDEPELIVIESNKGKIYHDTAEGVALLAEFESIPECGGSLPIIYYIHSGNSFGVMSYTVGWRRPENNYTLQCMEIAEGQAVPVNSKMYYNRLEAYTTLFEGWIDEHIFYQIADSAVSREDFLANQEGLPKYDRKLTLYAVTEENIDAVFAADTLPNETGDFQKPFTGIVNEMETHGSLNERRQAYFDFLKSYAAEHDPSTWKVNMHGFTNYWYGDVVIVGQVGEAGESQVQIYRYYDKSMEYVGGFPYTGQISFVYGSGGILCAVSEEESDNGTVGGMEEHNVLRTGRNGAYEVTVYRKLENGDSFDYYIKTPGSETFTEVTENEYKDLYHQQTKECHGGFLNGYTYTEDVAYRIGSCAGFSNPDNSFMMKNLTETVYTVENKTLLFDENKTGELRIAEKDGSVRTIPFRYTINDYNINVIAEEGALLLQFLDSGYTKLELISQTLTGIADIGEIFVKEVPAE